MAWCARELEAFVAQRRGPEGDGLPAYVEGELRRYLACGILAHGFTRVRCAGCKAERLVAFSCKGRGVCPSCGARRMSDTAARLVERVLPVAPYRQWVLTVPFALRFRLARDPARITRGARRAAAGHPPEPSTAGQGARAAAGETAAVTFVQRFGSALNLHPHLHAVVPDALFVKEGDAVRTVPLPPPTTEEVRRGGEAHHAVDHGAQRARGLRLEALGELAPERVGDSDGAREERAAVSARRAPVTQRG